MSLVPVNRLLQNRSSHVCWVCHNSQQPCIPLMIVNCNCQPQGVHESCLLQSISHIKKTNPSVIKQSDEFPDFEYYACPHCEKELYFRPDLSYRYKRDKYKTVQKLLFLIVIVSCLVYVGLMIAIAIQRQDEPWVFIVCDTFLLLLMAFSIQALRRVFRTRFYWLYEGLQLERKNVRLLKENLT